MRENNDSSNSPTLSLLHSRAKSRSKAMSNSKDIEESDITKRSKNKKTHKTQTNLHNP